MKREWLVAEKRRPHEVEKLVWDDCCLDETWE